MTWESWMELLNSPAGYAIVGVLMTWLWKKLVVAKPSWQEYEGTIISAVRWAEKNIPDTVPNKSLARLDSALRYVLTVYEETHGLEASKKLQRSLKEGIQIVHHRVEVDGGFEIPYKWLEDDEPKPLLEDGEPKE